MPRLVIVGASLAGLRAAQSARREGWAGEILVVGEERHMPYTRPPLSKEFLTSSEQRVSDHLLRAELDAVWLLGERATALDQAARRLTLADGQHLRYDRLVIATGSRPRNWAGDGAEVAGVHVLRRVEDAMTLRGALAGASSLAIIGAGFIGCEVAASARALGLEVTLCDVASTPMPALGDVVGERCAALHRAHGVDLRLRSTVVALHGAGGKVGAIEFTDGDRVEADAVLIALGAIPCTDWLASSGLRLDPGVCCDETLTVDGDPNLLAAGDVVSWPHSLVGGARIRVEHWTNAAEQGAVAGRNATRPPSQRETYSGVPAFWSDQYDVRIQALGLPHLAQRVHIVEESDAGDRFVAVAERDGSLLGAIAFNGARRMPWYRRQIGLPLDLEAMRAAIAGDPSALGLAERVLA